MKCLLDTVIPALKDAVGKFEAKFPSKAGAYNGVIEKAHDSHKFVSHRYAEVERLEYQHALEIAEKISLISKRLLIVKTVCLEMGILLNSTWFNSLARAYAAIRYPATDYTGADIAEKVTIDPYAVEQIVDLCLKSGVNSVFIVGCNNGDLSYAVKKIFKTYNIDAVVHEAKKDSENSIWSWYPLWRDMPDVTVLSLEVAGISEKYQDLIDDVCEVRNGRIYRLAVSFQSRPPKEHDFYNRFINHG